MDVVIIMKNEFNKSLDTTSCNHCGICSKHCLFLQKYKIDIGEIKNHKNLAYHCFLCGKCTEVCPKGIDGREIILKMRREQIVQNNGRLDVKGYELLLFEKKNYLFRNYRKSVKSVIFPGCNFPSFYPKTMKTLIQILGEKANIGVVFDCCGKPIGELGLQKEEKRLIGDLNHRLLGTGVEEVIMVCPNCYEYLKDKLQVKVVSIYEKLLELGIGQTIDGEITIFRPCPDRMENKWISFMGTYLKGNIHIIEEVSCCGLGGCAGIKEPGIAKEMPQTLRKYSHIYTYCGSCAGNLKRNGCKEVSHLLSEILEVQESADVKKSFLNRVKTKFW